MRSRASRAASLDSGAVDRATVDALLPQVGAGLWLTVVGGVVLAAGALLAAARR